jgi:hypothetical protein
VTLDEVLMKSVALLLACAFCAQAQTPIWPMDGHDPQRTSLSQFAGPTNLNSGPVWTFAANAGIVGGITISQEGNLYFVTNYNGLIYALKPDGTQYVPPVTGGTFSGVGPLIDDQLGYVYVAESTSGWNLERYNKDLTNGKALKSFFGIPAPSSLILGPNNTIVFFQHGFGNEPGDIVSPSGTSIPFFVRTGSLERLQ